MDPAQKAELLACAYQRSAARARSLGRDRLPIWGKLDSSNSATLRIGSLSCSALVDNQSMAGFCMALERRLTSPRATSSARRKSLQLSIGPEQVLDAICGWGDAKTRFGRPVRVHIVPPPF